MGVAYRMPPAAFIRTLLFVLILGVPAWAGPCQRKTETSSPMFGAKWAEQFVLYTQDYYWKESGDITSISMFYGESEGCIKGIKAHYGADPANAQRLGVETKKLNTRSIQLKPGERVVRAEYKASNKCIEYLSLRTNQGRDLAVGRPDSPTATAFAGPTNPNGYLGYFNGHTAKAMANPNVGKLMQLQLVWVSASCSGTSVSTASSGSSGRGKGAAKKKNKSSAPAAAYADDSSSSSDASSDSSDVPVKCTGNHLCKDGKCATSSCSLAGVGSEVPNMMCHGTNVRLPFLSSGMEMSPCSFLGCKLDLSTCTSSGIMGVGGYCTGRVAAMAATAMLHPQGKQWLGYPCIEHRAGNLGFKPGVLSDLTIAEGHVAKSWKVCDCMKKAPLRNSLSVMMTNGTITSYFFGKKRSDSQQLQQQQQQPTVAVPLMPVYDMGIKDVVTQWLVAHAGNAALPEAAISTQLASDLKQLVPGFMTPSIVIANTSAALMSHPSWMVEAPVFVLPDAALTALKSLLPDLTSLPTLVTGPDMSRADAYTLLELPKNLTVAALTVDNLHAVAATLGLPTVLKLNPSIATARPDQKADAGPHVVPLDEMHIGSVVVQWATAVARKSPLPRLVLKGKEQLAQLQAKVPGLVTPSIIVPNISTPLLFKPQHRELPFFVLPAELTPDVMALLPDVTSLPSYLLLQEQASQALPEMHLTDFLAPNMRVLVETLGPSIPILLKQVSNMSVPTFNLSMAGLAENPAVQSMMAGPWAHMLASLPELPDLLIDATSLDMNSITGVIAAVKDALATSSFKLPYLTMTDDTLQQWGFKRLEGFVTNIVTRAMTAREDPSLMVDNEDDDAQDHDGDAQADGDEDEESQGHSDKKRKHRRSRHSKQKHSKNTEEERKEAEETARKHSQVAAALSAMKEEQQLLNAGDGALKGTNKAGSGSKETDVSKEEEEEVEAEEEANEGEEDSEDTGKQKQTQDVQVANSSDKKHKQQKQQTTDASGTKPSQKSTTTGRTHPRKMNVPTTNSAEPLPKPAFKASPPNPPAAPAPAPTPAPAPAPAQAPAESTTGKKGSTKPAAASPAARDPAAAKPPMAKPGPAAHSAAAPAKPLLPVGFEDEDGAVVVDEAAAKRAFMTEEQWAGVTREHREKLLKLLNVDA